MQRVRSALGSSALPVVLLVFVLVLDSVAQSRRSGILLTGLLDEPAHLATAGLVLLSVVGPRRLLSYPRFTTAALVASVAIDIDHLPLYAGVPHVAVDGGRPFTHSLATVLVLLVAAGCVPRGRVILVGLAAGVCLHFVRDLATGPGVSLFWPLSFRSVEFSYQDYVLELSLVTVVAVVRSAGPWSAGRRDLRQGIRPGEASRETQKAEDGR